MNYYGVGVKFGGTQEMLPLYLENDCWFMGFRREEKPSFYETAQKVQPGDVMIAKATSLLLRACNRNRHRHKKAGYDTVGI